MTNLIVVGTKCTDPLCNITAPKYDAGLSMTSRVETGTEWVYGNKSTQMDEIYDELSIINGTRPTSKYRFLSLYANTFFTYDGFSGYCGLTPKGNDVNNFASVVGYFNQNNYTVSN